jgi:tellurite resistance protein
MALNKDKMQKALDELNASGKSLQQLADEQKTEALENMKGLKDDPDYAKLFDEK